MSSISDLEKVFMDAYDRNLVEFVQSAPDYIKVSLRDTEKAIVTLYELTNYIKKNFPGVRYFHIDVMQLTFSIYHFRDLQNTQRLADEERKP